MTPETAPAAVAPLRRSRRDSAHAAPTSSAPAAPTDAAPTSAAVTGATPLTRAERRRIAALGVDTDAIATTAPVGDAANAVDGVSASAPSTPAAATIAETVIAQAIAGAAPLRRRDRRPSPAPVTAPTAVLPPRVGVPAEVAPVDAGLPDALLLPHERDEVIAAEELADSTFAGPAAHARAERVDEFEFAARLFAFSHTPAVPDVDHDRGNPASATAVTAPIAPVTDLAARRRRRPGRAAAARITAVASSVAVMGVVGLLAVGTTTPASVVSALSDPDAELAVAAVVEAPTDDIQAYVAAGDAQVEVDADRHQSFAVESMADVAAGSGVTKFSGAWVNDPSAPVQWPFAVGVPISAGYGASSYLSSFGTEHKGVDFTPGEGAAIQAVADGTVRIATEAGGNYGVTVVIDHIIDGQLVSTRYGHMQYGSLRVSAGQTVSVGQVIGTVGSTGKSTGPHLHLEVLLNGTENVDPYQWMLDHT